MDSPFLFNKYVTGKNFVGRRSDCVTLASMLSHGNSVAIWEPPKSGKMSAIQQSLYSLRQSGYSFILCELDLLNIRTPQQFVRKLAGSLIQAAASTPEGIASLSSECLGQTSLVFDPVSYSDTGELFPGSFPLSEEENREVLELPYRLAEMLNTGVIVILKEFQNIDSDAGERLFKTMEKVLAAHRNQVSPFCSWVFTGSRYNAMESIFGRRRYFWNLAERFSLSEISDSELADHVLKGFMSGGKVIDRELLAGVCRLLRNNIWYVNHFFFICDSLSKGFISENILNDALSCLISVHEPRFKAVMNDLTDFQERLLRAVIDGHTKFSSTDVIEKYALNSSANVKRLKDALMKKEVIAFDEKDEPWILDPLFEYWLRKVYFKTV
jgi:uncharacterized protein